PASTANTPPVPSGMASNGRAPALAGASSAPPGALQPARAGPAAAASARTMMPTSIPEMRMRRTLGFVMSLPAGIPRRSQFPAWRTDGRAARIPMMRGNLRAAAGAAIRSGPLPAIPVQVSQEQDLAVEPGEVLGQVVEIQGRLRRWRWPFRSVRPIERAREAAP